MPLGIGLYVDITLIVVMLSCSERLMCSMAVINSDFGERKTGFIDVSVLQTEALTIQ